MDLSTLKVNTSEAIELLKSMTPPLVWRTLYRTLVVKDIPSRDAYAPHYSPWLEPPFSAQAERVKANTGLKPQSLYTLTHFLSECLRLEGDVIECGVWRGGSARLLHDLLQEKAPHKKLYLFDSFEGMAAVDDVRDRHAVGDFQDTSLEHAQAFVTADARPGTEIAVFRKGWVPATFAGLEHLSICFAHIDLDLYQSISDALAFVYPRLASRGVIVFDDYGFASCPGARKAVDEFFADKAEAPFVLSTGQAVVLKR
jgi:O-methyltransferase